MVEGTEFIIVGDTEEFDDCLIYTCGRDRDRAELVLNRIINNPTENDKRVCEGHKNFRIKEVNSKNCWWNYNCD